MKNTTTNLFSLYLIISLFAAILEDNLTERADVLTENENLKEMCNELRAKCERSEVEINQTRERVTTLQQTITQLSDVKNSKNSVSILSHSDLYYKTCFTTIMILVGL